MLGGGIALAVVDVSIIAFGVREGSRFHRGGKALSNNVSTCRAHQEPFLGIGNIRKAMHKNKAQKYGRSEV
jgi:hypothetical protein